MKKTIFIFEKVLLAVLCCVLLSIPFYRHVSKILCYLAIALWLSQNILEYKCKFYRFIFKTSLDKAIAVFFLTAVISTIFGINPYHSQKILFQRYLPYFALFYLGADLVSNSKGPLVFSLFGKEISLSNLDFISDSFLLLGAIFGIGGIWDYIRFNPKRLWTIFGNEIIFKMLPVYLVYLTPFIFALFIFAKNKLFKIVNFIIFGLLFSVLLFTGSRGPFVSTMISLGFIIFLLKKKKYFLFLFFLIVVIIFTMPQKYKQRVETIFLPFNESTYVVRKKLISPTFKIFKDYPVLGVGPGVYEKIFYKYSSGDFSKDTQHVHAHNTYLEILCEMGFLGFVAFLCIFLIFFNNVFRELRLCQVIYTRAIHIGLVSSIIASLLFAFFCTIITVGFHDAPLFWLLLGFSSGIMRNTEGRKLVNGE